MTGFAAAVTNAGIPNRNPAATEIALQRLVTVYVVTGLAFLLLPGTFLGVWNLVSISGRHSLHAISQSWLQAHGHAQIFGWLGTFIIGIGYYSLSKMGQLKPFAASRGWTSWALWTCGVALRWIANISEWHWRLLLPVSAALQLTAFLIFFATVSGHKPRPVAAERRGMQTWMKLVLASTIAFLLVLLMNQVETIVLASGSAHPEIPHWLDQRYLFLAAWGFPVLAVWGFNAKWLPVFLGLREPPGKVLLAALAACGVRPRCGAVGTVFRWRRSFAACHRVRIRRTKGFSALVETCQDARSLGLFPSFVRGAYVWLLIAAALASTRRSPTPRRRFGVLLAIALRSGSLATMVFAIGQRVLPAFCGMRLLYSKRFMLASLAILNLGCLLRVASEVPAYEANLRWLGRFCRCRRLPN